MNCVKIVTFKILRTYGTKSAPEFAGIRGKMSLVKTEKNNTYSLENFDQDDTEMYESEFLNVAESCERDERVTKSKELLQYRIIKSKCFKVLEPNFLTYVEKDQIKKLHDSNPQEWTPERLSKSFPALPETIRKILKSKWVPKSVEKIIKYDSKVIENWKNLKTDNLAVSPTLKEHLMKFKGRKINLLDKESLKRFVSCQEELPKPRSKFFLNIIEGNIDGKKLTCNGQLIDSDTIKRKLITNDKSALSSIVPLSNCNQIEPDEKSYNVNKKKLVFNEFIKEKLSNLHDVSREEKQVLLNTYRKYIESTNLEDVSSNMLTNATKDITKEKNSTLARDPSSENVLTVTSENQSKLTTEIYVEHTSLETYVKEKNSYMDINFDYIKRIKIPKSAFKDGMTYRINDCYYDDDGEFLYRVPGLRT